MKKLLSLALAIFAIALLGACEKPNLDPLFEQVVEGISLPAQTTENLNLPTTSSAVERAVLSWNSSLKSVITNSGVVIRQDEDKTVTLTLTVKIDDDSRDFQFNVTVPKKEPVIPEVPELPEGASHVLDLSTATTEGTANSYVSTLTNTSVLNKVNQSNVNLKRVNANIQTLTDTDITGIVTSIRSGNNFASPSIETDFMVDNLTAIEFTFYGWATDAEFNLASHLDKLLVQTSLDGTTWNDAADITDQISQARSAKHEISVELDEAINAYVRILVQAKTGIESTYQLRFVFTEMIFFGDEVVYDHDDVFAEALIPEQTSTDLTLITESALVPEAVLSWSSNNTEVLSNTGAVVLGSEDVTVELTLTVTIGEETLTKVFTIVILKEVIVSHEMVFEEVELPSVTDFNVTLITKSTAVPGATLVWASSHPDVISTTGLVTRSGENVSVVLTLSVTIDEVTEDYPFTVIVARILDIDAEGVAEIAYTGATANMTGNNDAATLGVYEGLLDVRGIKNEQTNFPGLNASGQIRLYYDGKNKAKNGTALSVTITAGYVITGVKFTFGGTTGDALITLGEAEQNLTAAEIKDATKEFNELDITSFIIQNVNEANVQIYILKIEVTYKLDAEYAATIKMEYPGGKTINMTGRNDAAIFGLNPGLFNIYGLQNGHNLFPGLNTNKSIRLYAYSGNGNTLVVKAAKDFVITKVVIEFDQTVADALLILGAAEVNYEINDIKGQVITHEGLSINSFSLQNVIDGANTQIHIKNISITYAKVAE